MKAFKVIPIWASVFILLLLANLAWMSWNWRQNADRIAAAKLFRIQVLKTNELSGVGIYHSETGQPLWTRFSRDGQPVIENHYFRGKDVFDVVLKSNRPPVYYVYFYGPGKSVTWWLNAGGAGTFTQRVSYDPDGKLSRNEVWYGGAWCVVDRRDGTNGIVLTGQWYPLGFDADGMWTIETP